MDTENNERPYVRMKDSVGNEVICPLGGPGDARIAGEPEMGHCFERDVVERYAGVIHIVER